MCNVDCVWLKGIFCQLDRSSENSSTFQQDNSPPLASKFCFASMSRKLDPFQIHSSWKLHPFQDEVQSLDITTWSQITRTIIIVLDITCCVFPLLTRYGVSRLRVHRRNWLERLGTWPRNKTTSFFEKNEFPRFHSLGGWEGRDWWTMMNQRLLIFKKRTAWREFGDTLSTWSFGEPEHSDDWECDDTTIMRKMSTFAFLCRARKTLPLLLYKLKYTRQRWRTIRYEM